MPLVCVCIYPVLICFLFRILINVDPDYRKLNRVYLSQISNLNGVTCPRIVTYHRLQTSNLNGVTCSRTVYYIQLESNSYTTKLYKAQ
jgi:hypothetical protein